MPDGANDGKARVTPGRTRFSTGSRSRRIRRSSSSIFQASVRAGRSEHARELAPLIETYLSDRPTLAGVLLLIDIRRNAEDEELDFVPWLHEREKPVIVALTKADKLPKNKRNLEVARARKLLSVKREPVAVSTLSSSRAMSAASRWSRTITAASSRSATTGSSPAKSTSSRSRRTPIAVANSIAATLLAYALDDGRAQHCTIATLEVRRGNRPATALYERAGFAIVHVRQRYYVDNNEDALVMTCDLTQRPAHAK